MINKLVSFLLVSFLSLPAIAQGDEPQEENKVSVNSNRKYKNEIGIDLSPLKFIQDAYSTGYPSIFFRKHFTKKKTIKSLSGVSLTTFQAFRFRIGSNFSFQQFKTPDLKANYNSYVSGYSQSLSNNSGFFLRIGKERQYRSGRFELFYGYDLFYNYNYQQQYTMSINLYYINGQTTGYTTNSEHKNNTTTTSFGIAGIGGIKYFLIPRLCFSAEATLNLGYSSQGNVNEYNTFDTSTSAYTHQEISIGTAGFTSYLNPLFVVNMGYYF